MSDNTTVHSSCASKAHLVDLFLFQGHPVNNDQDREVFILINQGYVVGFCPDRLQCVWAAYRVAGFDRDVDFDRPHLYYEDKRLDGDWQISPETFGTHNGVQYHVGHMVPNEVINRQFGRLAQLETFFMSNMSPQRGTLNGGVWLDLENRIRNIEDTSQKDHVWAIAGPIFGDHPDVIIRNNGRRVPIPESYYCIVIDPFRYPWNRSGNVDIAYFNFPQDAERHTPLEDFLVDRSSIEERTNLRFFPTWDLADEPIADASPRSLGTPATRHRLLRQLD